MEMKMTRSKIWHITSGIEFPLQLWRNPQANIELINISLENWDSIEFQREEINIVFVQVSKFEWEEFHQKIISKFDTHPQVQLLIFCPTEDGITSSNKGNFLLLEYPLHKLELKWLIDKSIQAELYKRISLEISNSCLSNVGFFEGLFELARKENKDRADTLQAYEKFLEYEEEIKKFQDKLYRAIERVNELREKELLELHERIKAQEKLDQLRERELKNALELKEATEKVLEYTMLEERGMDKIIRAQDKLFRYTEQEIKALIEENKELKRRLGIIVD